MCKSAPGAGQKDKNQKTLKNKDFCSGQNPDKIRTKPGQKGQKGRSPEFCPYLSEFCPGSLGQIRRWEIRARGFCPFCPGVL